MSGPSDGHVGFLREYFETDFVGLPCYRVGPQEGDALNGVEVRVHYDFIANAKFLSCYVPPDRPIATVCEELLVREYALLSTADLAIPRVDGLPGDHPSPSAELRFGGRCFVYHEGTLPDSINDRVRVSAALYGTSLKFRGPDYLSARLALERPRAFILHDVRDQNHVARPLVEGLARRGCLVWFHNYSLSSGSKPGAVFAAGVKHATTCILVVSPYFLRNRTWNPVEFHRVVSARLKQPRLLYPVWYGVTAKQVRDFSPALSEHAALRWDLGSKQEDAIAELYGALRR